MESDIGPIIIISGIRADETTAVFELRRRGLIVKHKILHNNEQCIAVCMSRKLTAKLAAENDLPVQPIVKYSLFNQLTMANQAAAIIKRTTALNAKDSWVAHDKHQHELEAALEKTTIRDPNKALLLINGYYGSQIALYYGFLTFYINSLVLPMVAGGLLFLYQMIYNEVDCAWLPVFCLGSTIWSTFFLETWKGRCAELAYAWGVYGWEDKELTEELARGASKEVGSVEVRRALSYATILVMVYVQVVVMLRFSYIQTHAAAYFGTGWYVGLVPPALYFMLCSLMGAIFHPVSRKLNDFEMHPTKAQAESSLVVKRFAFTFVNQFSALFYAAFWQRDLLRVRSLLFFAFLNHTATAQVLSLITPHIKNLFSGAKQKVQTNTDTNPASPQPKAAQSGARLSDTLKTPQKPPLASAQQTPTPKTPALGTPVPKTPAVGTPARDGKAQSQPVRETDDADSEHWAELITKELARPSFDLEDDYLEMAVQFGQLSLFAVAFPLAPLLAYASNLIETRTDFAALSRARRPPAVIRSTIGAWQSCFEFLSFASVFTNCFLLALVSTHIAAIIPASLHHHLQSDWGRLAAMMAVEHLLIAAKIAIMLLVDDVPQWMRESLARDKVTAAQERLNRLTESAEGQDGANELRESNASAAPSSDRRAMVMSTPLQRARSPTTSTTATVPATHDGANEQGSLRPSLKKATSGGGRSYLEGQLAAEERLLSRGDGSGKGGRSKRSQPEADNLACAKLSKELSGQFGFDPINMSGLIAVPLLLQSLGTSPYFYVPLAVLYFAYLQAKKDRADRKAAIGIISDPALIKLVVKEMPRWVSDSEHQRVEWFNSVLSKLWPQLSYAIEPTLKTIVQDVLGAQPIAVTMGLVVKRFTLGNISPKVVGIRIHETHESSVRLDVELRWAGEPIVTIAVGSNILAPNVELAEFRLSALIRIELLDLMPALPCFRTIAVTCMESPDVHFSLKLATLDFMNMGPSDFSVAAVVRAAINSALSDIVVYPKKMLFPVVTDSDPTKTAGGEAHEAGTASAGASAAVGVLYLTFERGVHLKKANWLGCNAHILAQTDRHQTFRGKTVYGTRNPEWGETFELLVFDAETQRVEIAVMDGSATLGKLSFGLRRLKQSQCVNLTLQLTDTDTGELDLSYEYLPLKREGGDDEDYDSEDEDILFPLSKKDLNSDVLFTTEEELAASREHRSTPHHRPSLATSPGSPYDGYDGEGGGSGVKPRGSHLGAGRMVVSQRFAAKYAVGILSVSMIHIRNLKVESSMFQTARPYVEVSIADKHKRTKPVSGTAFPHYPEAFTFIVKDLPEQKLRVDVKNKLKVGESKLLGSIAVRISDVLASGGVLEREYILGGAQAECYVGLRLEVTASS